MLKSLSPLIVAQRGVGRGEKKGGSDTNGREEYSIQEKESPKKGNGTQEAHKEAKGDILLVPPSCKTRR